MNLLTSHPSLYNFSYRTNVHVPLAEADCQVQLWDPPQCIQQLVEAFFLQSQHLPRARPQNRVLAELCIQFVETKGSEASHVRSFQHTAGLVDDLLEIASCNGSEPLRIGSRAHLLIDETLLDQFFEVCDRSRRGACRRGMSEILNKWS